MPHGTGRCEDDVCPSLDLSGMGWSLAVCKVGIGNYLAALVRVVRRKGEVELGLQLG